MSNDKLAAKKLSRLGYTKDEIDFIMNPPFSISGILAENILKLSDEATKKLCDACLMN